jgi:uncharacterized membrane protein YkvA (DUF1232 family)
MDSNQIRTMIHNAIEHEEKTGNVATLLAEHLAISGVSLTAQQQSDCLDFIKAYIRETPDIMDAAYFAAQKSGVLHSMQPVFDAAFNYWAEPYDFIPDNLGLIGLTDDAYLTQMFMETISNLHRQQTGQSLLDLDLGPANKLMRNLIGEPVVTQLETVLGQTIASQIIQITMQQLSSFTGGLNIGMTNLTNINDYDLQHEVDVRLGAMGVV